MACLQDVSLTIPTILTVNSSRRKCMSCVEHRSYLLVVCTRHCVLIMHLLFAKSLNYGVATGKAFKKLGSIKKFHAWGSIFQPTINASVYVQCRPIVIKTDIKSYTSNQFFMCYGILIPERITCFPLMQKPCKRNVSPVFYNNIPISAFDTHLYENVNGINRF